jgi:hypothetical protein
MLFYSGKDVAQHMHSAIHHPCILPSIQAIGYSTANNSYFGVGILLCAQHKHTQWSAIDAWYFSMVTLTTVGYGDNPDIKSDDEVMLFTAFYVLRGACSELWILLPAAQIPLL